MPMYIMNNDPICVVKVCRARLHTTHLIVIKKLFYAHAYSD